MCCVRNVVVVAISLFLIGACGAPTGGGGHLTATGEDTGTGSGFNPEDLPGGTTPAKKLECEQVGLEEPCFDSVGTKVGVGECISGIRTCDGEYWSACIGQVIPIPEYCDSRDNDCDGDIDEGVLSACGDCNPYCTKVASGIGTEDPLEPEEQNSLNVVKTPEGWITLTSTAVNLNVIWVANSQEGTVSKLDTTTGFETGRYKFCSNPSRTAVGFFGNGWVACRSNGGRVARILNFEGECIDKNGNGVIDTSRDLNNDHVISGDEMLPMGQDECIVWTTDTGKQYGSNVARALGVHTDGFGWVGLWEGKQLLKIAPEDGQVIDNIPIPANPYGLVIDKQGTIWVSGRGGGVLVKAVPGTKQVSSLKPPGGVDPYGIALDEFDRVWIANCCSNHSVKMYDPKTGQWASVAVKARPRGLVANLSGRMFVANDQSNQVAVIDMNAMQTFQYIDLGGGRFPLGMALDAAGFVWAVNQQSGSIHKINSFSLEKVGEYPVGTGPYTSSDMTGSAFFDAVPPGWYRHRFEAAHVSGLTGLMAMNNAQWVDLTIDYVAPPEAYVKFRVRTGESKEEIDASLWTPLVGPFPDQTFPVELSTVLEKAGHFLDVEVWLYPSKDGAMPILKGMDIKYEASP